MQTIQTNVSSLILAAYIVVFSFSPMSLALPAPDFYSEMINPDMANNSNEAFNSSAECVPGTYTSNNVLLRAQLPRCAFGADGNTDPNDLWAYVSPSGRRYAIVALFNRVVFVEVTDPDNPVIIGRIRGGASIWRDMKVHGHFCYIVRQQNGLGIQIVDMSDIDNGVVQLANETTLGGFFFSAPNIAYNPDSGFFYLCIPNINSGIGLVVVDPTSDPANPVIAGFWNTGTGVRCHDALIVNYDEGIYAGREIAFCFAEDDGLIIGDVTDKNNMFTMSTLTNFSWRYTHQGWISSDRRHLFVGDEMDESDPNLGLQSTRTYVVNIQNLHQPFLTSSYNAILSNNAIDHNMMAVGRYLFQANYTSGMRVLDVSNVVSIFEAGFYDTFAASDGTLFRGAWGVYAGFGDGMVLVSDMQNGFFVLDISPLLNLPAPPTQPLFPSGTKKNRYISFINNFGAAAGNYQVRRFINDGPPEVVGWVGPPDERGISEIVQAPPDPPIAWPNFIVEAGDCEIIPATTYQVFATSDNYFFADPLTIPTSGVADGIQTWGDVTGKLLVDLPIWLPADDKVDVWDILAVLHGVTMNPLSAGADRLDLAPEVPDGVIDSLDLQSVVDAFTSQPYPFADAASCVSP